MDDQQNHQNLILLSTITRQCTFSTMDCEAPDNGLTPRRPLPSFEAGLHRVRILTSLNGLVCVGLIGKNQEYSALILWNPVTSEYKKLSKKNSHAECYDTYGRAFGLYYNSSEDDYKLLRVTHDFHAYIYSLKSDSWRKRRSMISSSKRDPNLSSHRDPYRG
ncbi:putative F-box domain-containing protein [Tanacetum coccineum]